MSTAAMYKRLCAALFLLLVPDTAMSATLGDAQTGFSADRLLVIDGRSYNGKIWAMPGKERHEQAIQAFHPGFLLRADSPLGEVVSSPPLCATLAAKHGVGWPLSKLNHAMSPFVGWPYPPLSANRLPIPPDRNR